MKSLAFKKQKFLDPWPKGKWPSSDFRKNQYAYHIGLLDKYSKGIPSVPATLKRSWGTSNKGIQGYFSNTTGAAV